jgi:hypothetical protein
MKNKFVRFLRQEVIFSEVECIVHYSRRWKEITNFFGDYFHMFGKVFPHC